MRRRIFALLVSFLLLLLVGSLTFLSELQPFGNPSQRQVLKIPVGSSFSDVARLLYQRNLIKNDWAFQWMGRFLGKDRNVIPGEYEFAGGMAPADVLDKITKGEVVQYAVTIPEGYSLEQIADILQVKGLVKQDEFMQLTQDSDFLAKLNFQAEALEGYLFPDTYHFTQQVQPKIMVRTMIERFNQVWTEQLQARAVELGMSVHQLSLIHI